MIATHKVAKADNKWFVAGPKGWTAADGTVAALSASPKQTKFLTEEAAKELGFSPSEIQKAALGKPPALK